MTTIGDMEFSIHFMDGYWGREYKGATDKHKEAYERGDNIRRVEDDNRKTNKPGQASASSY